MGSFKLERGKVGDRPVIHFESKGKESSAFSDDLIWAAPWLPPLATVDWITENEADLRQVVFRPEVTIPALVAYLQAIDIARETRDPQLVRDLNHLTGWIESIRGLTQTSHSRMIDEAILDMPSLERLIQAEIGERAVSGIFNSNEYARLRRLGFKPEQIPYEAVYRQIR